MEKTLEQSQKDWYDINAPVGKRFGYPQCCIDAFCLQSPEYLAARSITNEDYLRYKAGCIQGEFTGFIPCAFHARMVLKGELSLHNLIVERDPSLLPFPSQW